MLEYSEVIVFYTCRIISKLIERQGQEDYEDWKFLHYVLTKIKVTEINTKNTILSGRIKHCTTMGSMWVHNDLPETGADLEA